MKTLPVALGLLLLAGCAATNQGQLSNVTMTGFLGNYNQLSATNDSSKVLLRYVDTTAPWSSYTKIRIEPVTFWAAADSSVPLPVQQQLTDYAYQQITADIKAAGIPIVADDGPGVVVVRMALTDATSATPGLRTISVVVPQARVLSLGVKAVTGQTAFAGSVQSEGEVLDSVTGKRIAAWVDRRTGGASISNANVWQWGDAENVINFWAQALVARFTDLRQGKAI